MPSVAAVCLDMGNVLAFHDDALLFRRMAAWGGADADIIRQRVSALWDPINRGILAGDDLRREVSRAAGGGSTMPADEFLAMWNCHFRVHHEVLPVVDALLDRVKVLLLSNTNDMHWRHIRARLPQFERFSAFVLSYELGLAKPDPGIYQVALARVGLPPERVAFFDDVPAFVDAARALGIAGRVFTDVPTFRAQLAELGVAV